MKAGRLLKACEMGVYKTSGTRQCVLRSCLCRVSSLTDTILPSEGMKAGRLLRRSLVCSVLKLISSWHRSWAQSHILLSNWRDQMERERERDRERGRERGRRREKEGEVKSLLCCSLPHTHTHTHHKITPHR